MKPFRVLTHLCWILTVWTASDAAGQPPGSPDSSPAETASELIVQPGEAVQWTDTRSDWQILAAIDGGVLRTFTGPLIAPTSGDHWLAMASRDALGTWSAIAWTRLRVDAEPPQVELAADPAPVLVAPDQAWVKAGTLVVAQAHDAVSGVAQLTLKAADQQVEQAGDRVSLRLGERAGEVSARAWAVDRVGQRSADATLVLRIDPDPPEGEIVPQGPYVPAEEGVTWVLAPTTHLEPHWRDAGSGVAAWSAWIDEQEVAPTAWQGPWPAGPHSVAAAVRDRVGNVGRIGPLRVIVDAAGPQISWQVTSPGVQGDDGVTYYVPPVNVEIRAQDEVAGVALVTSATDGTHFTPFAGQREVAGEELVIRAQDRVDNWTEERATWQLDRDPPTIRVLAPDGQAIPVGARHTLQQGDSLTVAAEDPRSGVAQATYCLKGPPCRVLPRVITMSEAGEFLLEISAQDRAGHSVVERWTITVLHRSGGKP